MAVELAEGIEHPHVLAWALRSRRLQAERIALRQGADAVARPRARWLLLPDWPAPEPAAAQIARFYRAVASFGEEPTPAVPGWWHGNRQRILVLERRRPPGDPPAP